MWHTVKETAITQLHPQKIIHLAAGYVRVLLSPYEAELLHARLSGKK